MTTVSILPVPDDQGGCFYEAVAGVRHAAGPTPGMALDAIANQIAADVGGTLVVVHNQKPDQFFTAEQQQRLQSLMAHWRKGRELGAALSAEEAQELQDLVQLEVAAAGARASAMASELNR